MTVEMKNINEESSEITNNELTKLINSNKTILAEMLSGKTHASELMESQIDTLQELFDMPSYQAQEEIAALADSIDSNETEKHYSLDIDAIEMASMTGRLGELLKAEARV